MRLCSYVAGCVLVHFIIVLHFHIHLTHARTVRAPDCKDDVQIADPSGHQTSSNKFTFKPNWSRTRTWIGPDWWATPLWGWGMKSGSVITTPQKETSLALLSYQATASEESFTIQVTVRLASNGVQSSGWEEKSLLGAGLMFGSTAVIKDYRAHAVYPKQFHAAAIYGSGQVVLGPQRSKRMFSAFKNVNLNLRCVKVGSKAMLTLSVKQGSKTQTLRWQTSFQSVVGLVGLYTSGPSEIEFSSNPKYRVIFKRFSLTASKSNWFPTRRFGPILWTQYILSQSTLYLQSQLALIKGTVVHFELKGNKNGWRTLQSNRVDTLTHTVKFVVKQWDASISQSYRVRILWEGKSYEWKGVVRKEPQKKLSIGCFSCDFGYMFPHVEMTRQVARQNPDMLYFAGDQIYEYFNRKAERFAPIRIEMLEFLERFYLFGWTWRALLGDRPSVIIPDDHDVFQGNLFGQRGKRLPPLKNGKFDWNLGGYGMSGTFVNAVQKCNAGHLPPPEKWMKLGQGIKPYFTSFVYGGIGFAVLEDRKFKSGPATIPESKRNRGTGGALLGPEQEKFLKKWSKSWEKQHVKIAFSQTLFGCGSTHTGKNLERVRSCMDSGAWPIDARNRAVRLLADAKALSLHGDQHVGMLVKQGVKNFNDAGYAFMVPGTANGYPRAWWPGVRNGKPKRGQRFTGKFYDDAGTPLNVLAVGNPKYGSGSLDEYGNNPLHVAFLRGSGYGLVEINTVAQTAKISLFRTGDQRIVFDGFPKQIYLGGRNWTAK